ncbi:MAG TPA: hydroxysqualene dehydroxylase HpnE, partial [Burkholderiales bacterium]|nr:hydroxysqualene dehydroxylase HpnE [Burkholderiales bacterium]
MKLETRNVSVAIIGGGFAGLAAAVELASRGVAVTLLEAAKQLGGRARRVEYRGVTLDNGCHILLGCYRETLRLIDLTSHAGRNCREVLLRLPLELRIEERLHLRAAMLPAPLHVIWGLAMARGLSLGEKRSAARFMLDLRRTGFRLECDETVAALLARHGQAGAVAEYLWRPLCLAALNTGAEQASAQVFLNVLRDSLGSERAASDLLLPRADLSAVFPDLAGAYVIGRGGSILLGRQAEALETRPAGFIVPSGDERLEFSHVICALPPQRAAELLQPLAALAPPVEMMQAFSHNPICSVYLQYPVPITLPAPMLGLAGGLGQWAFDKEWLCGQRGLIAVVISGGGPHESLSQDDLAQRVHEELKGILPDLP